MSLTKQALWNSLLVLLSSAASFAQSPCSELLKFGIFDTGRIESEESIAMSYVEWLEHNKFSSYESAADESFSFGIVLPEVDFGIGLDREANSEFSGIFSEDFSEHIKESQESRRSFVQEFSNANPLIIEAFRDCIGEYFGNDTRGMLAWVERGANDSTLQLCLKASPTTDDTMLKDIIITDITIVPENIALPVRPLPEDGLPMKPGIVRLPFQISKRAVAKTSGIDFSIISNPPGYDATCSYLLHVFPIIPAPKRSSQGFRDDSPNGRLRDMFFGQLTLPPKSKCEVFFSGILGLTGHQNVNEIGLDLFLCFKESENIQFQKLDSQSLRFKDVAAPAQHRSRYMLGGVFVNSSEEPRDFDIEVRFEKGNSSFLNVRDGDPRVLILKITAP